MGSTSTASTTTESAQDSVPSCQHPLCRSEEGKECHHSYFPVVFRSRNKTSFQPHARSNVSPLTVPTGKRLGEYQECFSKRRRISAEGSILADLSEESVSTREDNCIPQIIHIPHGVTPEVFPVKSVRDQSDRLKLLYKQSRSYMKPAVNEFATHKSGSLVPYENDILSLSSDDFSDTTDLESFELSPMCSFFDDEVMKCS
eukprot:CAMPEP_0202442076 /NCGR_PEP_ID=MMETSP1360-20130828/1558_1 /ASSEMBLY_ACC=CAM_ASM_000848 /TAXON_ID=515479 /ORGANISM="Licmophora paradoxa, Strain CCMP2313" /LENGTH=200 /DNA_ID=CAMNT_0049057327 /DNA_START=105 /DNA_END=707 /DNA_ORIENTATION=-